MMLRTLLLAFFFSATVGAAFAPVSVRQANLGAVRRFATSSSALYMTGGVVITGGAAGVGFAYAGEFMDRGYNVVICDVKDSSNAAAALTKRHPNGKVFHTKCDVSSASDVEQLGKFAQEKLGTIGYWINNAGINGGRRDLRDVPVSQVEAVVKVNLLGVLLCTKKAMEIMGNQAGVTGHIFNTVGSGVKGGGTPGYACYGATKRGLPQLTASLGTLERKVC
jgi:chlorophyll(ide) b reductase